MSESALNPANSSAARRSNVSFVEKAYTGLFIVLTAGTLTAWLVFLGWLASRII